MEDLKFNSDLQFTESLSNQSKHQPLIEQRFGALRFYNASLKHENSRGASKHI